MIDFNTLIGPYPWRHVPHPDAAVLDRVIARDGLDGAWVGHLPSAFHRDPSLGNKELFEALAPFAARLRPVPTIRPDWPGWKDSLRDAKSKGAVAVRAYPQHWGMGPSDGSMRELAVAAAALGMPIVLTVKFEDLRQRHSLDVSGDLQAAAIRHLARAGDVRIVVTAAGRETIEEVHWGLTPEEQGRVFWDVSWIWGPPEDHLAKLLRTIGPKRFVYGTHWPMRLTQTPRANLDLLPEDVAGAELAEESDVIG